MGVQGNEMVRRCTGKKSCNAKRCISLDRMKCPGGTGVCHKEAAVHNRYTMVYLLCTPYHLGADEKVKRSALSTPFHFFDAHDEMYNPGLYIKDVKKHKGTLYSHRELDCRRVQVCKNSTVALRFVSNSRCE